MSFTLRRPSLLGRPRLDLWSRTDLDHVKSPCDPAHGLRAWLPRFACLSIFLWTHMHTDLTRQETTPHSSLSQLTCTTSYNRSCPHTFSYVAPYILPTRADGPSLSQRRTFLHGVCLPLCRVLITGDADRLEGLPLGPVILCGHSMGGLLIAEAATSTIHVSSKRIIALLAFDVPFLGMHPHVVISGIASLLADKKSDPTKHTDGHEKPHCGLKGERVINSARHVEVLGNGTGEFFTLFLCNLMH